MGHSDDLKNLFGTEDLLLSKLTEDHILKSFDCGNRDLNDFLFKDSKTYLKHLRYTTFIFETSERTIAYFSLANDLLTISIKEDFKIENEGSIKKMQYAYLESFLCESAYPAVKIGRLAVDKNFQNKGIGTKLINMIIYSLVRNNKTGCQFITVDALNNVGSLHFYEKNGFNYCTVNDVSKNSRQMYKSLIEYIV